MYTLIPFDSKVDVSNFDSGVDYLDNWLKNSASRANLAGVSKVYLLVENGVNVKGYYTISPHMVLNAKDVFTRKTSKGFTDLSGYLIGKLAVDKSIQNKKFGKTLLFSALSKIFKSISETGGTYVGVDAIDEQAKNFYKKYGFHEAKSDKLFMYLTKADMESFFSGKN